MFTDSWADGASVTPQAPYGPNFTRAVTDQLRLNNLRGLIRTAFTDALGRYWQGRILTHQAALDALVAHYYTELDRQFQYCLTEIDRQLILISAARERRAACRIAEQERFTRFSAEVLSIQKRLQELERSVNCL